MKKRIVFFRLMLLLFLIAAPLYLFRIVYFHCKVHVLERSVRKENLISKIRENSLTRNEDFLENKNYRIALEKLEKEKLQVEGVVIVEQ
ncbi:hypothetical protein [Ilyobacter polytropus]|uniref:Septum formation initiator n=1 Tax=Ilyobacter polytropus (strain ATCC 51220 / DSM 2926 / LMG 16218 / CuHBu1) TaxID=572544 RepID=E3H7P3_ILYPC|nr:hypothetical protein [Ilyobacter polytropus]ADO82625.1 hypothetical protein Ilyop_0839 [Ilyobacter polytropus DSM 2926]